MYTQSYFRYRYSTEEAGCHFLENDKKKWVELGGISHTRKKKKGKYKKIKGGNVSRRNDLSQRVGFGVCSRKKKKGPRKDADDQNKKKKIENLTAFLIVGRKPGKATSR